MTSTALSFLCLCLCLGAVTIVTQARSSASSDNGVVVDTVYGPIRGNVTAMGHVFTSIPFAAPPIHGLRWMPPQAPKPWTNHTLDTTQLPPQCPQVCDATDEYWCAPTTAEDCLYLNVWTPLSTSTFTSSSSSSSSSTKSKSKPQELLPVLVWIYGGGFQVGWSAGRLKNGTVMANKTNSIVVSMNYRVGAIGFYYNAKLDMLGNYGYLDQVFAIEWVHANIAQFGGDPTRITIYGESAGAASVALHVLNQTSLISGAIFESFFGGAPMLTTDAWDGEDGMSDAFSEAVRCNPRTLSKAAQIECLQAVSVHEVVQKQGDYGMQPTVNTSLLAMDPVLAVQQGLYKQGIPILVGLNDGEYYYMMDVSEHVSYSDLRDSLEDEIGVANAKKVLAFYDIRNVPGYDFINETAQINTDMLVKCPSRNVTAVMADTQSAYFYHFQHISSTVLTETGNVLCTYAACHTTEVPYVFNDDLDALGIYFTRDERLLAQQFQNYWSNFAANADPNVGHPTNVKWLAYNYHAQRNALLFDVGSQMQMASNADKRTCDFWDSLNYDWLFAA